VDAGFEATWVGDVLHGQADVVIMERLRESGEILVTRDVRFANMVGASMVRSPAYRGVVLIREQNLDRMRSAWVSFLQTPGTVDGIIVITGSGVRRHRFT
jgi:uncharacterized protein YaiI (UPF0178 family)